MTSAIMTSRARAQWLLLVMASLIIVPPCASAWSNGGYSADENNPDYGTHDWIAEQALAMQTRDVMFLKTTYHTQFLLGTEAPDNPEYIGDTTNHHIYFYSSHQVQDDVCADRASAIYQTALEYLAAGEYANAAYDLGVLTHYVADPGVFGHTMGAYTDWGAETHHSDYEDEIDSMIWTLPETTGLTLRDADAYSATLDLGETITFGGGDIKSNVWMDTNYDWNDDVFEASAVASLRESIEAVAAVVNYLMIEFGGSAPAPEAPDPPTTFSASVQGSHVVLIWSAPPSDGGSAITSYEIYRSTDPDNPLHLASVSAETHSWTDKTAREGRTYYYWIVAENSEGASDMVRIVSVTIPKDSDSLLLPIAISVLSAVFASSGVLLWRRSRGRKLQ